MTGKEALKQLEEKYHKYIIEWYYMSNMSKEERDRLYKMYDEEIKIIDKQLTKYERAFEILKDKLAIEPMKDEKECWFYFKNVYSNGYTDYVDLKDEEYELLEELMNNASNNN